MPTSKGAWTSKCEVNLSSAFVLALAIVTIIESFLRSLRVGARGGLRLELDVSQILGRRDRSLSLLLHGSEHHCNATRDWHGTYKSRPATLGNDRRPSG